MLRTLTSRAACPLFVTLLLTTALVAQDPPRVVSIAPVNRDAEVDAKKVEQIVVKFDQPMSTRGWSFCGGGPAFPTIPDGKRPYWKNNKTIVLPVALEPDHSYRFSLNCGGGQNFRSTEGVALVPVPYSISTLPAKLPNQKKQRALNKKAYGALQDVLERSYSYYDTRGLDWKKLHKTHSKAILASKTTLSWTNAVGRMLEPTNDLHLSLRYADSTVATGRRAVDSLYRGNLLERYLDSLDQVGRTALIGKTEDGIGYLMIPNWSDEDTVAAVEGALPKLKDSKAIIVDVRPNSGGDELLARSIARWFVVGKKVYAKNRTRTGKGKNGFGPVYDRVIAGNREDQRFDVPVAVLISPYIMSSCEAFVLMMEQATDCTSIGQPTWGSSGNPKRHELPNEVTLVVPSWQAMLPDGTCFEGVGIEPDIMVAADSEQLRRTDPILSRALEVLREKIDG